MHPELEALIKALDAAIQAQRSDSERLEQQYEALLADALQHHPSLSLEALGSAVQLAYRRWTKAQTKFPTLPPQA